MLRDLHDNIDVRRGIDPVRVTDNTAQVSAIIDLGNRGGCEILIYAGTLADADATFQVLFEDGNDSALADHAEVDSTQLLGIEGVAATPTGASFRFDSDNTVHKLGYIGGKRYVRLTITPAANTGNADICALFVLSRPRKAPQSTQTSS